MATYIFEDLTAAQATTFSSGDTLLFNKGTAADISVAYQYTTDPSDPALGGGGTSLTGVVVTDAADGVSQTFGPDSVPLTNFTFTFTSGALYIGGDDDAAVTGLAKGFGGRGDDSLGGGAGTVFLQGNQGADTLVGGAGDDTLFGGQGTDSITGAAALGHNWINGNVGADTIQGGAHGDTILGGQDGDSILAGGGNDYVSGDLGDDTISGGGGNDTLFGQIGNDSILGGAGNELVNGNTGNDTISGGASGTDTLYGGQDNDSITNVSGANDLINGNVGNDTITITDTAHATVHGGQGNDLIHVTAGASSYVFGDLGADTITSDGGFNDTIVGGDGADSISGLSTESSTHATSAYSIDGGAGVNTISVTHGFDSTTGTYNTADTIVGGADGNTITVHLNGSGGADTISAFGNDLITTGDGNDSITITVANGVTDSGHDTISAGAGDNTITATTTAGGESITTGDGADSIVGGTGGDTIVSGNGNDTIVLHNDTATGHVAHVTVGAGHDTITGGDGQLMLTKDAAGSDQIILDAHQSYATTGAQDRITGWNGAETGGDTVHFGLGGGVSFLADTGAGTFTDYAAATSEANTQMADHHYTVVALQVGANVVVFADVNNDNALNSGDTAVVLVGQTLSNVHAGNFVG